MESDRAGAREDVEENGGRVGDGAGGAAGGCGGELSGVDEGLEYDRWVGEN